MCDYNFLLSADDSYNGLLKTGFDVCSLEPLFLKYDVQEKFNLSLLHRHYFKDDDEILVSKNVGEKIITSPEKINGNLPTPTVFALTENSYIPYEYSNAEKPIDFNIYINFFNELFHCLQKAGVQQYLGLNYQCDDSKNYVEHTVERENILTPYEGEIPDGKFIPTSWSFAKSCPTRGCKAKLHCSYQGGKHVHSYILKKY